MASPTSHPISTFADAKHHYTILDALRGVAAITVVLFHLCESHATSRYEQIINHGYLAVDFFFALSGFVIGYAYDDRWGAMSWRDFFKRRLIRLHPMIVLAMLIGAGLFYCQAGQTFTLIHDVPLLSMLLLMLIGMALIPIPPNMDIRGWAEMYPLNGPAWSLFFEYIANILYALVLRKLPTRLLALCVGLAACYTIYFALTNTNGDMIGGWSLNGEHLHIGFARLMYPFLAGLLLSRLIKPRQIKHAFVLCSLILLSALSIPRIGDATSHWMNGLYDAGVIIVIFPLIIFIGASGTTQSKPLEKLSSFLGGISYPLYIIHYPFIYTYMSWVQNNHLSAQQSAPIAIITLASCILLAHLCFKFYDVPVRRWLTYRCQPR